MLETFSETLRIEAGALEAFAANPPEDFAPVVEMVLGRRGKIVVAGVGKSGHIGRKIAATLASTGTPAFFIHPTEASHGDLGMIQDGDACLLISNSGETAELKDLIYHCKRFSVPLIGMSAGAQSTLMRAADFRLTIPAAPEACPLGLAPMSSATLALVMGDALAACLINARGFQPVDFGVYHPAGNLSARIARVADLMHVGDAVPLVAWETGMNETILVMTSKGFGIAGVLRDGKLAGVITDGDLRRQIHTLMSHTAGEVMTADPITVTAETLAAEALSTMEERSVAALIVTDAMRVPIGVLHMHDLLRRGVA